MASSWIWFWCVDKWVNHCSREIVFVCIFLTALPLPCENFHLASEVLDLSQSPKKTMTTYSDSQHSTMSFDGVLLCFCLVWMAIHMHTYNLIVSEPNELYDYVKQKGEYFYIADTWLNALLSSHLDFALVSHEKRSMMKLKHLWNQRHWFSQVLFCTLYIKLYSKEMLTSKNSLKYTLFIFTIL